MRRELQAVLVAAWLLAAAEASCFGRSCKEERVPLCTRLPLFVKPTDYFVHLKFPSVDSDTYEGKVFITINFPLSRQKKRSLVDLSAKPEFAELIRGFSSEEELCEGDFILLHAGDNLDIKKVDVLRTSFKAHLLAETYSKRKLARRVRLKESGYLALKLARGFYPSNENVIAIEFTGKMRQDKRGIYVSNYNDGQNVYKHIVSQFQPTDARSAFPCFDEPRFRAKFTLSVTHGSELTAYSNTNVEETEKSGEGLSSTRFATTPKMPVHMLAFVIGQFDQLESAVNGVKVRVLTAPGKRESGHFALQVAKDSLAYFEKYINFKFPLAKLDVVAIADHDKDNTESWGLVFVRDTLLWIDDETKPDTKITTAVNVAHVVVHQWFGNLISAAWWSELWITEGVAAQFAFRIVQELYPFQSEYFARIATLSGVMQTDQPGKLHALSPPVDELQTTEQIYGIFDNLEFMKSGSMAELMRDELLGKRYQEGLRRLVARRAYKTVTKDDYLAAMTIDKLREKFPDFVDSVEAFIKFKGVPLVNVFVDHKERRLMMFFEVDTFSAAKRSIDDEFGRSSQSVRLAPFLLFGSGATGKQDLRWARVKAIGGLIYTQSVNRPSWFNEQRDETAYVKVSPNPSFATYFRTRYSDELLDHLKQAVQNKWISPMDRLQLLDDYNQLALAGLISPETFGKLIEAYAQEDDSAVLIQMLACEKALVQLEQTAALASIQPALVRVFENYGFQVTGDEGFLLQRMRQLVLKALVTKGNQQVIEAALKAYEDSEGQVALFLREPVYTAIVVSGSDYVNQLQMKLLETKSYEEQIRLIGALSLSHNKQLLVNLHQWLLSSGLKGETIKPFSDVITNMLAWK